MNLQVHSESSDLIFSQASPTTSSVAEVVSFQLQPAHFPPKYAAAIVEMQEMKQDIQVAEQENKTKAADVWWIGG